MIPESQDPYTCGVEIPGPFGIVGGLICFRMSAAVQFDRQPGSWAVKVEDEALEDMLAPKLETVESVRPKQLPQSPFGFRGSAAKLACKTDLL
jgi:hypothetical protein